MDAPPNLSTMDQRLVIGNSQPRLPPIHGTAGLMIAIVIWLSAPTTTRNTTITISGARKISMYTAVGLMQMSTAGFGGRMPPQSTAIPIGRRIVTADGSGFHLMAGPG